MKTGLLFLLLATALFAYGQKDIDVVYLKSGVRFVCEIQQVSSDSIYFTQFRGRNLLKHAYPLDQTSFYLVNNHYSTPGEEMAKVSRRMVFGATFFTIGGTLAYLGYKDDRPSLMDIGFGVAAVSGIFWISGAANMRKVGKKMDKLYMEGDRLIFKL
jgi:hypothetical protein